ncbi:hypothetical protein ACN38_g7380 [Penicillium nordicum]|uniref:Uncharacterized protein n=1 Tax=Penicillium nordicum TaxID=229535 RepID=A0A0M8P1P8_9EURO|nr:hypothetical protein ACN38_g7380 [Penicillium nordicum]
MVFSGLCIYQSDILYIYIYIYWKSLGLGEEPKPDEAVNVQPCGYGVVTLTTSSSHPNIRFYISDLPLSPSPRLPI